ncbi:hypothetical protein CVT26_000516 [Gymnopilus dilepis]|uniref:Uncharacterized protein n=1 Tax=Gymnopilus dilepis TaxID=231916 RepID=A0A409WL06_9AGAR|nr:hypothetical protein CVT26_000516 [Gymnopilus dilepis]
MTNKRRWNPIENLLGFTNLRPKKRKIAKKKEESNEMEADKENPPSTTSPSASLDNILDLCREPRQSFCETGSCSFPTFTSAISILPPQNQEELAQNDSQTSETVPSAPIDDSDSVQEDGNPRKERKGNFRPAPSLEAVEAALHDLDDILKPARTDKSQSYRDGLDKRSRARLVEMQIFCRVYINHKKEQLADPSKGKNAWTLASIDAARLLGHAKTGSKKPGDRRARQLREWIHAFIDDREEVPICDWKTSGRSLIDDPDFAQEIHAHLQSLKPHEICAEAIVRRKRWVRQTEKATPYQKGEGHSLMVADFFSAEYGWLRSRDGKLQARILFRAGKGRDGYFDNNAVRSQLETVMDIVRQEYPDEDHVFVFDNARTHSKRPEGSQSVLGMTKGPSAKFMVEVNETGEDGKPKYTPDGKIAKKKVPMANGRFHDGTEQAFYWRTDTGHPLAGQFKGMVQILEERGYANVSSKKAQCGKKFTDCDPKKGPHSSPIGPYALWMPTARVCLEIRLHGRPKNIEATELYLNLSFAILRRQKLSDIIGGDV